MKILGLIIAIAAAANAVHYYPVTYNNIGCWGISGTERDVSFGTPRGVASCAEIARENGNELFAVLDGGYCASSSIARDTYRTPGPSRACGEDGEGGSGANQVYEIKSISEVSLIDLGCWTDIGSDAVPSLEGLHPLLEDDFSNRHEAIAKCVQAAHERGYDVIGLRNGGLCGGSRDAESTYKKHRADNGCGSSGKGGVGANQVYRIRVLKTTTYGK